jgi:hypothetical protein
MQHTPLQLELVEAGLFMVVPLQALEGFALYQEQLA